MYIAPQIHAYDLFLYDSNSHTWTVDRFLDDIEARYGQIDGVLLWATYPNLGVDERNEFDITFSDLPGGAAALRDVVIPAFHSRGVRVGMPYNPWDTGTEDASLPDSQIIAELAASIGFDFVNGDTMSCIPQGFWQASLAAGAPLSFQPEGGATIGSLAWTKNSWGEGWPKCRSGCPPVISAQKWVEPRHLTQIVDRWATDKTTVLQQAFFNGVGFVSWENVWGYWNGMSARDGEATRRVGKLLRFLAPFLVSPQWEPHAVLLGQSCPGVFASRWPSPAGAAFPSPSTAWTLVNTNREMNATWASVEVPCDSSVIFFDLYTGQLQQALEGRGASCGVNVSVESGGYAALLGVSSSDATGNSTLTDFLASMGALTHSRALASFSNSTSILPQTMQTRPPTPPLNNSTPPPGMASIPGNPAFLYACNGTEIEGEFTRYGDDVQFPWESLPTWIHSHTISIPPFFMDITPVTNAAYSAFLLETHYSPVDSHNFLKDWDGSYFRAGWAEKPVTWVSLEDAEAFCLAAGKRLPHDWEWQWAMQGPDGRAYPFSNKWDPSRVPPQGNARDRPAPMDVGSFLNGSSPFGVLDGVGLVWQMTDVFEDSHTRAALVRGGSYYRPLGSLWYFPNLYSSKTAGTLLSHNKLLLMDQSYDRHGAIGFRCVADAAASRGA